jgi:hypothetical protein
MVDGAKKIILTILAQAEVRRIGRGDGDAHPYGAAPLR